MRFYVLSDLHLGNKGNETDAANILLKLCSEIRRTTAQGELVLFVVLGDIANKGSSLSFDVASKCLDLIVHELKDFIVKFEFVPGNHDLEKDDQNLILFDALTAKYGSSHAFNESSAYSKVYDNVNFIFADSTLSRDHSAHGQLDIEVIKKEIKQGITNILFCHHALTQENDKEHDTIENAPEVKRQLNLLNVSFFFHGHVHSSNAIIPKEGMVEIGFGSLSADISWDKSLFNQFGVCYIQDGKIVCVHRWVNTSEFEMFAGSQLYPHKVSFSDPNKILKVCYEPVENYISRKVLPYDKATDNSWAAAFLKDDRVFLKDAIYKHKKVLLLSDAGMGKSLEIQNLAYELHDKMHTFLFSLRNYSNQDIFDLLPEQYKTLSPYRYALLFDGYDELNSDCREEFEKKLRLFIDEYAGAHIVITSRANFCRINNNRCNNFDGFEIFVLDKLSGYEVKSYLERAHIDPTRFYDIACAKKVMELIYTPFYLIRLTDIFLKKWDLPQKTELMNELVKSSFVIDAKKFPGDLEDHYRNLFFQLESVALVMQLMHKQTINDYSEFQEILPTYKTRELVKKSGLLKREGESWLFIHNNFREYLAARYLSKMSRDQVISIISDGKNIKPSWVNTLGYLTGIELDWDLLGWLSENSPSALVKFESDRLSAKIREEVFKRIFIKNEKLSLYFNDELCDEIEIANFAKSNVIVRFLMDRIANPRNIPSQYSAVNILRHFPTLMGLEDEVRDCLVTRCENYPQTSKTVCRLCLLALCQLKLGSFELTSKLMHLFGDSQDDYIRLGMYEYLMERDEHNTYVQYFLDGIQYIQYRLNSRDNRVGNEGYELTNGLKNMSTLESISSVLKFLSDEKHLNFHSSDEVVLEITNKAIMLYKAGTFEIYDVFVNCYIRAAKLWNHLITNAAIRFFKETCTLSSAVPVVVDAFENSPHYIPDLIYATPDIMDYLKVAYCDGSLKSKIAFPKYVIRYVRDAKKYTQYAEIIKNKEGDVLPEFIPVIDYDDLRSKAVQQYFDSLFDKDIREGMLLDLVSKIGDTNIVAGTLLKSDAKIDHYSALWHLKSAIYRYSPEDMKVKDFFNNVDIEDFILCVFAELLESSSIPNLSLEQQQYIYQIILKHIKQGAFINAIIYRKNGFNTKNLVPELIDAILHFKFELDEETMLQLTEIPSVLFNSQKESVKYEFIESRLPKERIKERLIENVRDGRVHDMVLKDHLDYFCDDRDPALKSFAVKICKETFEYSSLRMSAWKYIYEVIGVEYFSSEVLPTANGDFLVEINGSCKDIPRDLMRVRMEEEYKKSPNNRLLAHLITLGSKKAIREYVKFIKKNKKPPEGDGMSVDGPTAAIECVNNPAYLPLLEKLLVCILNKKFVDISWRGLKNTLARAFVNCGKLEPNRAIRIVERHKPRITKNEADFRMCNYIVCDIKSNNRSANDAPVALKDAKTYLKRSI
ncbi:MAG: metallophosphoesterase [Clostridia bacterium]|nr:metallophosphoesterase [Clostridia bacterium]